MPKKAFFESAKHHILLAAKDIADQQRLYNPQSYSIWRLWVNSFTFIYLDSNTLKITWDYPKKGSYTASIKNVHYYFRGDTKESTLLQKKHRQLFVNDQILKKNNTLFQTIVMALAKKAHIPVVTKAKRNSPLEIAKIHDEEQLSDLWASSVDLETIDVVHTNTALCSPELRFIHKKMGNIKNKKILDLGCGLGEVSVYLAMKGARVTAVDLSLPMLHVTQSLAKRHNTKITTLQASVENLKMLKDNSFDYIYVGNVFHHVDISLTLRHVKRLLKPQGTLFSWEPVGYNPIINIYRKLAFKVRSRDERPFKEKDIELFQKSFKAVEIHWFWLTTLVLFLIMAGIERRNPNKERYWKSVIRESDKWKPIYTPLERLDRFLLKNFPRLGFLCWNVVLICKKN